MILSMAAGLAIGPAMAVAPASVVDEQVLDLTIAQALAALPRHAGEADLLELQLAQALPQDAPADPAAEVPPIDPAGAPSDVQDPLLAAETPGEVAENDDNGLSGFVEGEGRWFPRNSDEGIGKHLYGSVAAEPSLRFDTADGRHSFRVTGFGRLDTVADHRTHADLREAKWVGSFGAVEAVIGVDRMFWGVTEAAHIVNIINQIDALEDIDREDFLGQPLASLSVRTAVGSLTGYVMPVFRERRFPGAEDRPNAPLPVDRSQTRFEASKGDEHVDWAARWQSNLGPVDLGLHYFSGTDRDPSFFLTVDRAGRPVAAPFYELIDQVGLDAQVSLGSLALKFEGINRWTDGADYGAIATGFEYTLGGILPGGGDLGLLGEYLWNDGNGRGPSQFEDDFFVGARWSGNDERSTELLAGMLIDADGDGLGFNIEGSRRISESIRVSVDARLFTDERTDSWEVLRDDGFVQLKLQWFF